MPRDLVYRINILDLFKVFRVFPIIESTVDHAEHSNVRLKEYKVG